MAFNVGITSKDAFKQLKQLSPRKRVDAVSGPSGVSMLSMLTPVEFAELFPKYYEKGLQEGYTGEGLAQYVERYGQRPVWNSSVASQIATFYSRLLHRRNDTFRSMTFQVDQ